MTHAERRDQLRRLFDPNFDAILISSAVNVRYLTGFTGGNATMKESKNGKKFTRISLATSVGRKNRETGDWSNSSTWYSVVV